MQMKSSQVWVFFLCFTGISMILVGQACTDPTATDAEHSTSDNKTSPKVPGKAPSKPDEIISGKSTCTLQTNEPVRFLALGDSYTIGQGVDESERWPVQLSGLLRDQGIQVEKPVVVAGSGWTTSNLQIGIDREKLSDTYDLVSVLIGVNDQVRGISLDRYREKLVAVLERAIALADNKPTHVVVMSVPDWSVAPIARAQNPERIRNEIDEVNRINRAEAEQRGMPYVDITPLSRQAANDPTLLAKDNLHSSGKMYSAWARKALPTVCQALAK